MQNKFKQCTEKQMKPRRNANFIAGFYKISNQSNVCNRDVHGGAAAAAAVYFSLPSRRGAAAAVYFLLPSRRGSGSFQKKKILKTREFTQNFHFKERYTVKLDEFHRL
jgi:hypothetical protein